MMPMPPVLWNSNSLAAGIIYIIAIAYGIYMIVDSYKMNKRISNLTTKKEKKEK